MKTSISLEEYLSQYGKQYPKEALDYIKTHFNEESQYDIIIQIRSKMNLISSKKDIYQGFIKYLNRKGLLQGEILEVAAGFYPILSERMSKKKKVRITTIDPKLVTTTLPNIRLIKREFPEGVTVERYDTIIAMKPCEATIPIIDMANKHHKNFSIMICGCAPEKYQPIYYTQWENYIYHYILDTLDEEAILSVDKLKDSYECPFPIYTKTYQKK